MKKKITKLLHLATDRIIFKKDLELKLERKKERE